MRLAYEPARLTAYFTWNANVDKKWRFKSVFQVYPLPWDDKKYHKGDALNVQKKVLGFRNVWQKKWGFKYHNSVNKVNP